MYSSMSKEEKVAWLRQWNESGVLREANKFPKHCFLDAQFDKWLYKATFWHQVILKIFLYDFPFFVHIHYHLTSFDFCNLKLSLKKAISPASKKSLLVRGVQIFSQKKRNLLQKGRGKKTTPLKIVEVPDDVTMVDYEVTTSKWDFVDLHEGFERRHSSKRLDLLLESCQPSSSQLDLFLVPSRRTLGFHLPKSYRPPSSRHDLSLAPLRRRS